MLPEYTQTYKSLSALLEPLGALEPEIVTIVDDEADMLIFNLEPEREQGIRKCAQQFCEERYYTYNVHTCPNETGLLTVIIGIRF